MQFTGDNRQTLFKVNEMGNRRDEMEIKPVAI